MRQYNASEHMLFLGTEKYPVENDYSSYLSENGGYSNAYTGSENTNYYFSVNKTALHGALDRFAQFFISPLFNSDCVNREINAVDSEHKKNLQQDNWRMYQLIKDLSDENHPFHKFGTGNMDTLMSDSIRDDLIQFHSRYYSSGIMKLVVYGVESLETLKGWVVDMFTDAKDLGITRPVFSGHPMGKEQKDAS